MIFYQINVELRKLNQKYNELETIVENEQSISREVMSDEEKLDDRIYALEEEVICLRAENNEVRKKLNRVTEELNNVIDFLNSERYPFIKQ